MNPTLPTSNYPSTSNEEVVIDQTAISTTQDASYSFFWGIEQENTFVYPITTEQMTHHIDKYFSNKIGPIVKNAIESLFCKIDFLGYQLDHEFGNISEEEFNNIADDYFNSRAKYEPTILSSYIESISKLTKRNYDEDEVSMLFNCKIEDVERIFEQKKKLLKQAK